MSPFLTTLGGGSVRGFGRGRKITAVLGPTTVPTSLSVTPDLTSVQLSWTNTDNISQIRVYRGASLVTTLSAATTTYTNTGLSSNTSYSFTVRYFKDAIEGSASNTATTTTLAPQVPTITNLTFSHYSGETMGTQNISFTIPVSGPYQVQFQVSEGTSTGLTSMSAGTTSHTISINNSFYRQACTTVSIRARLYNTSTATYLEWGNYYTTSVPSVPAGNQISATCSGCNYIATLSNGGCGTYTQDYGASSVCCPPNVNSSPSWSFPGYAGISIQWEYPGPYDSFSGGVYVPQNNGQSWTYYPFSITNSSNGSLTAQTGYINQVDPARTFCYTYSLSWTYNGQYYSSDWDSCYNT